MDNNKEEKGNDQSRSEEQLLKSRMINSFAFHCDFVIDVPIDEIKNFFSDLTKFKIKWSG